MAGYCGSAMGEGPVVLCFWKGRRTIGAADGARARRVLDQRGRLLRAALGFAGLPRPSFDRALWALRSWLDSWSGIGHVAVGMHRQGFDLQLTQYDERGWRATFYTTGMEHSHTSARAPGGSGRRGMRRNGRRGRRSEPAGLFIRPTGLPPMWPTGDTALLRGPGLTTA
jgi:hypothetical protein